MGPENLHFQQVPKRFWSCWSESNNLRIIVLGYIPGSGIAVIYRVCISQFLMEPRFQRSSSHSCQNFGALDYFASLISLKRYLTVLICMFLISSEVKHVFLTFISLSGTFCELPVTFLCWIFNHLFFHIYRDYFKILHMNPLCCLANIFAHWMTYLPFKFVPDIFCWAKVFHFNVIRLSVFYSMVCAFWIILRRSFPTDQ